MSISSDRISAVVRVRLVLPCIFLMLLSSLDRVNISFAALTMNRDLGLSPAEYGSAAGIFFVGYLVGQLPSVLLQRHIGMRLWVGICTLIWGLSATGMAFIHTADELWILRIVLGLAEGGLAPGIVLYLSQWSTESERARTFAWPMLAIPISAIFGAPLSGWLLESAPAIGFANWRWMFLIEGLPTIAAGIAAFFYFPNSPREAKWLTANERQWLRDHSALRTPESAADAHSFAALRDPLVWASSSVWFLLLAGSNGVIFWLPQVVQHATGLDAFTVSLISAVPWIGAAIGMLLNSWHSDRTRERFWHLAIPASIAGVAIALPAAIDAPSMAVVALFVAGLGYGAAQGAFWALPTHYLDSRTMTVGVATINIAGSTAGLIVPRLIGSVRETTGAFDLPIYLIASMLMAAALVVILIRWSVAQHSNGAT